MQPAPLPQKPQIAYSEKPINQAGGSEKVVFDDNANTIVHKKLLATEEGAVLVGSALYLLPGVLVFLVNLYGQTWQQDLGVFWSLFWMVFVTFWVLLHAGFVLVIVDVILTKVLPVRWFWRFGRHVLERPWGKRLSIFVQSLIVIAWCFLWFPPAKGAYFSLGNSLARADITGIVVMYGFSLITLYLTVFFGFGVVRILDALVGTTMAFWAYSPLSALALLGIPIGLSVVWATVESIRSPNRLVLVIPLLMLGMLELGYRLLPGAEAQQLRSIVSTFRFYRS